MNLERYVRHHILAGRNTVAVDSAAGLVDQVEQELLGLGRKLVTPRSRAEVETPVQLPLPFRVKSSAGELMLLDVDYRSLLEVVMRATTPSELWLAIAKRRVYNRDELDELLQAVPWRAYFNEGADLLVRADSRSSSLYHEGLIEERVEACLAKEGIAAHRSSGTDETLLRLRLRVIREQLTAEIAFGGLPLWRRGYRASMTATAPLREDLAQGAVRAALGEAALPVDFLLIPFAGSGTLLFESLIALLDIPPALLGRPYAFERFAFGAPPSTGWARRKLRAEFAKRCADSFERGAVLPALLIDRNEKAVAGARRNWERFSSLLEREIGEPEGEAAAHLLKLPVKTEISIGDAFAHPWERFVPRKCRSLFLPLNPPYGLRLKTNPTFYQQIGRWCEELARSCRTPPVQRKMRGFVLCPDEVTWRSFLRETPGLQKRTTHFGQGGVDVRLCVFSNEAPGGM